MKEKIIKTILLVTGAFTFTAVYTVFAPETVLRSSYGETLTGPVAEIVTRSWGSMVALLGAMLIYGAFHPPVRTLVVLAAAIGKMVYVALLLAYGKPLFQHGAGIAVWVDTLMVVLLVSCLVMAPKKGAAA